jgi:hypothetical protein
MLNLVKLNDKSLKEFPHGLSRRRRDALTPLIISFVRIGVESLSLSKNVILSPVIGGAKNLKLV